MSVALDAKGQLFPLAFGVCPVENQDNWEWFLRKLLNALSSHPNRRITWLSDRQKGLINAVAYLRPGDHHAFCLVHLKANFVKRFSDQGLVALLWKAARAVTEEAYSDVMKEMADINPKAAAWFTGYADPMYWSDAFCGGSRYGHYTSNISESANAWLREAREKPLVEMLEDIRRKLMGWFQTRREEGQNASAECGDPLALVPDAASLLAVAERFGRTQYSHRRSNESVFEVTNISTERNRIVDIQLRTCSCKEWQQFGIPCRHAAHCLLYMRKDLRRYVEEAYRLSSYAATYAGDILPIPPYEDWPDYAGRIILPPVPRKKVGRPRIERMEAGKGGRSVRCKRCAQAGHNIRTCQEPIDPAQDVIAEDERDDDDDEYDYGRIQFSGAVPPTPQLMGAPSTAHFGFL